MNESGLAGAMGMLLGAVAMKLIPAVSEWIRGRAGGGENTKNTGTPQNGNGRVSKEQMIEILRNHEAICGGKIEAKIDRLGEKVDSYHDEQCDMWDRINQSVDMIGDTRTRVAVQERRIEDHLSVHHRP